MKIATFHYDDGTPSPLSNFYRSLFELDGFEWPTVEHYFQAMKASNPVDMQWVRAADMPGVAKKRGREIGLRHNWDAVRYDVMRDALAAKFVPGSTLGAYLESTGDALLVEGNTWHDQVWGVCTCDRHGGMGNNWLGRLLMARRAELRSGELL